MTRQCGICGRGIPDGVPCPFCTESKEMKFDPMNEVLILHDKLDKINLELTSLHNGIQSLAKASLLHSQAFMGMVDQIALLNQAMQKLTGEKIIPPNPE